MNVKCVVQELHTGVLNQRSLCHCTEQPPVSWTSALRASAAVLTWWRHVAGQAAHSRWARGAAEVSFEACPLTPSPAPHLCSQRELDKEGDFENVLDSVDRTVPSCSTSNL